jgi:hypothetical protein
MRGNRRRRHPFEAARFAASNGKIDNDNEDEHEHD